MIKQWILLSFSDCSLVAYLGDMPASLKGISQREREICCNRVHIITATVEKLPSSVTILAGEERSVRTLRPNHGTNTHLPLNLSRKISIRAQEAKWPGPSACKDHGPHWRKFYWMMIEESLMITRMPFRFTIRGSSFFFELRANPNRNIKTPLGTEDYGSDKGKHASLSQLHVSGGGRNLQGWWYRKFTNHHLHLQSSAV